MYISYLSMLIHLILNVDCRALNIDQTMTQLSLINELFTSGDRNIQYHLCLWFGDGIFHCFYWPWLKMLWIVMGTVLYLQIMYY